MILKNKITQIYEEIY